MGLTNSTTLAELFVLLLCIYLCMICNFLYRIFIVHLLIFLDILFNIFLIYNLMSIANLTSIPNDSSINPISLLYT